MGEHVLRLRQLVGRSELLQIPSASIALRHEDGRVMLARHVEGNVWMLPGGGIEPGESPADAAVREMWEETRLFVSLTGLVGVFGGPEYVVHYRNGDRTSYISTTFEAVVEGGTPRLDPAELLEVRFVSETEAQALPTAPWMPEVLAAVFGPSPRSQAFRRPTWVPPHA